MERWRWLVSCCELEEDVSHRSSFPVPSFLTLHPSLFPLFLLLFLFRNLLSMCECDLTELDGKMFNRTGQTQIGMKEGREKGRREKGCCKSVHETNETREMNMKRKKKERKKSFVPETPENPSLFSPRILSNSLPPPTRSFSFRTNAVRWWWLTQTIIEIEKIRKKRMGRERMKERMRAVKRKGRRTGLNWHNIEWSESIERHILSLPIPFSFRSSSSWFLLLFPFPSRSVLPHPDFLFSSHSILVPFFLILISWDHRFIHLRDEATKE